MKKILTNITQVSFETTNYKLLFVDCGVMQSLISLSLNYLTLVDKEIARNHYENNKI